MSAMSRRSLSCTDCSPMYAVFMAIHLTHGRFDGYSDGHVDCRKPQSSLIDAATGLEVAWGGAWPCKRASKILEAGV